MSFCKAPIRRFNDIQDSPCSPAPGTYDPRFYTDVAMSLKRRISYDRGSCSTFSMISSTELSSSLSYSPNSNVHSNSSCGSRSSASSVSPQLQTKSRIPVLKKFHSKTSISVGSPSFKLRDKSPIKISSNSNLKIVEPQPQKKHSLSEKIAMEIISAANEDDQLNWLNTISSLQNSVYNMQLSLSALTDEVIHEKERSLILEMKNKALETMVENLQCRLLQLDDLLQQTDNNAKLQSLTETIDNLQIAEIRLKENFSKLEHENCSLAKNMSAFVMKIVDLLAEQNNWKAKEKEYVENISALDDILTENQTLLFQAEERLATLVEELEHCCDFFCNKLKESEEKNEKLYQKQIEYEGSIKKLEDKVSSADETVNEIQALWNTSEAEYRETISTLREKIVDLEYTFILFIFLLRKCNTGV